MSTESVPFCVRPGWERIAMIRNWGGPSYRLLFWADGVGFEHTCDRGDRGVIVCAPLLSQHEITGTTQITVTPSVSCPDCGTHGFITNSYWNAA